MILPASQLKNITEHEIVIAFGRNDKNFYAMLYDCYSPRLLGMIIKWVNQKETAELILLKAFIKVWNTRQMFNPENEIFYYWLCRQARVCYSENSIPTGTLKIKRTPYKP